MRMVRDRVYHMAAEVQEGLDTAVEEFMDDVVYSLDLIREDHAAQEVEQLPKLKAWLLRFLPETSSKIQGFEDKVRG